MQQEKEKREEGKKVGPILGHQEGGALARSSVFFVHCVTGLVHPTKSRGAQQRHTYTQAAAPIGAPHGDLRGHCRPPGGCGLGHLSAL